MVDDDQVGRVGEGLQTERQSGDGQLLGPVGQDGRHTMPGRLGHAAQPLDLFRRRPMHVVHQEKRGPLPLVRTFRRGSAPPKCPMRPHGFRQAAQLTQGMGLSQTRGALQEDERCSFSGERPTQWGEPGEAACPIHVSDHRSPSAEGATLSRVRTLGAPTRSCVVGSIVADVLPNFVSAACPRSPERILGVGGPAPRRGS